MRLEPINGAFGLPPSTWVSDEMIVNTMPVFEIKPCKPHFSTGLNLFTIEEDKKSYLRILKSHGFTTEVPIHLAFLADSFPTDTFTNEYGETFLQKFTDVASQGMSQLMQMTGSETASEGVKKMGGAMTDLGGSMEGVIGSILKSGGGGMTKMASGINKIAGKANQEGSEFSKMVGGGAGVINSMLAGHRVDFPQVWRNSGFQPSYTATVRLYNPNPGNENSTKQHIIGPLAVILALALPRSKDGETYNWPFFHKINAPGIYNLDPSVITNVTVIKGGDQQQISYNQKLAMVDVRIEFTSLYGSILIEENKKFSNRPTLRSYLKSLSADDRSLSTKRGRVNSIASNLAGSTNGASKGYVSASRSNITEEMDLIARNNAVAKRQNAEVSQVITSNRAPHESKKTEDDLVAKGGPIYTT